MTGTPVPERLEGLRGTGTPVPTQDLVMVLQSPLGKTNSSPQSGTLCGSAGLYRRGGGRLALLDDLPPALLETPCLPVGGGVERFRQTLSGFKPKSRDLPERALLGDLGGAMGVDLPGQRGEAEKRLVYRSQVYRSLSSPRQESNRYIERIGREGQ